MLLNQFLSLGRRSEACFTCPTGCPSLALQLGVAQPLLWGHFLNKDIIIYMYTDVVFLVLNKTDVLIR